MMFVKRLLRFILDSWTLFKNRRRVKRLQRECDKHFEETVYLFRDGNRQDEIRKKEFPDIPFGPTSRLPTS